MKTKTVKLGGSLYLRIPHEKVEKYNLQKNMDIYIHEDLWDEMFKGENENEQ